MKKTKETMAFIYYFVLCAAILFCIIKLVIKIIELIG